MLTRRLVVYSPQDEFQFELSPNDVFSAKEVEEINGEHSITIVTTRHLEKEQRILTMDATEKWREYVMTGSDGQHDSNERPFGTYRGVWSLQHDFQLFGVDDVIGLNTQVTASYALDRILRNTARWSRGTVTRSSYGGADMTQINGWEAMQLLIGNWGGEIDVTITVSNEKVMSRRVDLYEKLGNQNATRRFDYRHDLTSMRRKVDEMPVACRIRPYGKGEKTIDDIDVKITIEEVNDGKDYLQNDAMVNQLRLPNGSGGWEYPTINVTNTSIDDEEELLEWGLSVLPDYTTPKATYEASVAQFVAAGMGVRGVELGDRMQCIDREFDQGGGVRIESRIRKIENDLLDPNLTKLTLGDATESYVLSVGTSLSRITSSIHDLTAGMDSTSEYLNNLLEHLNEQINATGGYTYITSGHGLRTYDKEVSDPLIGAEADAVVEIKGGTIRIANSKTATGEWEWRSVFTSGHVAADMVTAANITAGYIGNAGSGSYWDLDNGVLYSSVGKTLASALRDAEKVATNYLTFDTTTGLDIGYDGTSAKTRINASGINIYDGNGVSALFAGLESSKSIVRVGKASGSGNVVMSSDGYVDIRNASTIMAHFGYGNGNNSSGGTSKAPYYNLGLRGSNSTVGNYSLVTGYDCTASGYCSHAEGDGAIASGRFSHAEGFSCTASGEYSHAGGYNCKAGDQAIAHGSGCNARGDCSAAFGLQTTAYEHELAFGERNIGYSNTLLEAGCGDYSDKADAMYLTNVGNLWIKGTLTQNSDRRLKEHHAYLGEEAADFIRALKPALYTKDGERHVGFYAQNVQEAEPEEWDTVTVTSQHTDESLDFDPLTLDYQALIAPLVAYAQSLEKRIYWLTERLDRLEA